MQNKSSKGLGAFRGEKSYEIRRQGVRGVVVVAVDMEMVVQVAMLLSFWPCRLFLNMMPALSRHSQL